MKKYFEFTRNKARGLSLAISIMIVVCGVSSAQSNSDLPGQLGTALGVYKLNIPPQKAVGFENFEFFLIKKFPGQYTHSSPVLNDGVVFVDGEVVTKDRTTYKFQKASIRRRPTGEYEGVSFKTVIKNGVFYTFDGNFLADIVQECEGGNYTEMRGVLTKHVNGTKTKSTLLPFYEHTEL